jgi:hypothetical protein
MLELGTPLYIDPPARDGPDDRSGGSPGTGGRRLAPPPAPGCECTAPAPGFSGSSFRFGAWGVGGIGGAVGGGFGGF